MKVEFKFDNGIEVKDIVTGVTGIVSAQSKWLNGCIRYSVQPKSKEGENVMPDCWWVDEEQLVKISDGVIVKAKRTGGPSMKSPRF